MVKKCYFQTPTLFVLELKEASKPFSKKLPIFCKFLIDEVEIIFWKTICFLRKWFWGYFELKNECSECLKRVFFSFLQIFVWRSWKRFLGKQDWAFKIIWIQSHKKLIRKWFWSDLEIKNECSEYLKKSFSFLQFSSDEIDTTFWESEARHQKVFKSKFGHKKLLRKWFWRYLEFRKECFEHLKRKFFRFLQIFEWRKWNRFLGMRDKAFKTI